MEQLVRDAMVSDPLSLDAGASAQEAGEARTDVTADDVLRMLSGIGLADYPQDGQLERVIGVCLDGLRPRS